MSVGSNGGAPDGVTVAYLLTRATGIRWCSLVGLLLLWLLVFGVCSWRCSGAAAESAPSACMSAARFAAAWYFWPATVAGFGAALYVVVWGVGVGAVLEWAWADIRLISWAALIFPCSSCR